MFDYQCPIYCPRCCSESETVFGALYFEGGMMMLTNVQLLLRRWEIRRCIAYVSVIERRRSCGFLPRSSYEKRARTLGSDVCERAWVCWLWGEDWYNPDYWRCLKGWVICIVDGTSLRNLQHQNTLLLNMIRSRVSENTSLPDKNANRNGKFSVCIVNS